jgi:hypothetical protein
MAVAKHAPFRLTALSLLALLAGAMQAAMAQSEATKRFPCSTGKAGTVIPMHGGISPPDRRRNVPGDGEKLRSAIVQCGAQGPISHVDFKSGGGSVSDGIEMAIAVREAALDARISAGSYCTSACTFAFLGGVNRVISPAASYNVHAFSAFSTDPKSCKVIGKNGLNALSNLALRYLAELNRVLGVGMSEESIVQALGTYGRTLRCDESDMPDKFDFAVPMYLPVANFLRQEITRFEMENSRAMLGLLATNEFGRKLRYPAGATARQRFEFCSGISETAFGDNSDYMQQRRSSRAGHGATFPLYEPHALNWQLLDLLARQFPELKTQLDRELLASGQKDALQKWKSLPLARQKLTAPPKLDKIDRLARVLRDGTASEDKAASDGLAALESGNLQAARNLYCLVDALGDIRLPGSGSSPSYLDRMFSVTILTTKALEPHELEEMDIVTEPVGKEGRR